jgi:hypothetical protein
MLPTHMRVISELLEAAIALFVYEMLGSLLTGSRMSSGALARRSSRLVGEHAWVTGFGGSMGWDGSPPPPRRDLDPT